MSNNTPRKPGTGTTRPFLSSPALPRSSTSSHLRQYQPRWRASNPTSAFVSALHVQISFTWPNADWIKTAREIWSCWFFSQIPIKRYAKLTLFSAGSDQLEDFWQLNVTREEIDWHVDGRVANTAADHLCCFNSVRNLLFRGKACLNDLQIESV